MWISKKLGASEVKKSEMETGQVTISKNGELEAVSTGVERGVKMLVPFGYSCAVGSGRELVLSRIDGRQVALGTIMQDSTLRTGEIELRSPSGAYIRLKNDGSVVINGLVIDSDGGIADD